MNKSQVSSPDRKRALREASGRVGSVFEALEDRVLLAGDHFSFFDFPMADAVPLTDGAGSIAGIIESAGTDDLFQFTVDSADFVTILADALNESGSSLDTRIELYRDNPMFPGTAIAVLDADNNVLASNNNGLASGSDAWLGSVLSPDTYYVRVLGQSGSTGAYTLRVDTTSTAFSLTDPAGATDSASGNITLPGADIVYKIDTATSPGTDVALDSLAMASAETGGTFDPRVALYDAEGRELDHDSASGRLSNAFLTWKSNPDTVVYVRVRGDQLSGSAATGAFDLGIVTQAIPVETLYGDHGLLDPVTRMGYLTGAGNSRGGAGLFVFTAQASGVGYVSVQGPPPFGEPDLGVTVYAPDGSLKAFGENFQGADNEVEVRDSFAGGEQYYIVVDSFGTDSMGGGYNILVEANHTENIAEGTDDHANLPGDPTTAAGIAQLQQATPLILGSPNALPGDPFSLYYASDPTPSSDQGGGELNDRSAVLTGRGLGRISDAEDTDLFMFVPPVDMLGGFEGKVDPDAEGVITWLLAHAAAPRVSISLQPVLSNRAADPPVGGTDELIGGAPLTFLNGAITVYDSRGNLVYTSDGTPINAPGTAYQGVQGGALDPSRWPSATDGSTGWSFADYNNTTTLQVWGGEPYYIAVSGTGAGRYTLNVSVDAMPDPNNDAFRLGPAGEIWDGFYNDLGNPGGFMTEAQNGAMLDLAAALNTTPSALALAMAREVILSSPGYDNTSGGGANGFLDGSSLYERSYIIGNATLPDHLNSMLGIPGGINPMTEDLTGANSDGGGILILQQSGLAGLEHPLDTDLFVFRAPVSGTVEIRINTTNLLDSFTEYIYDSEEGSMDDPPTVDEVRAETITKVYDSLFDSALRIFNNDGVEIAYNNDNPALAGMTEANVGMGTLANRTYHQRDARVVFTVEQGEQYFIQVESGQLQNYYDYMQTGGRATPVDWAHLIGSYELLINAVANTTGVGNDLPNNGPAAYATVIGTNESSSNLALNNPQVIHSSIENVPGVNPIDDDLFTFIAPANGTVTITVQRDTGSSLTSQVAVFNDLGGLLDFDVANGSGNAFVTFDVIKGQRVFAVVGGFSGSEGDYVMTLGGISFTDDAPDFAHAADAELITLNDFSDTGQITGTIEGAGDTDVYRLSSPDFWDTFTVTATGTDALLHPAIEVWEMTVDPVGNTVMSRVALDNNLAPSTLEAQTFFSLTPDRHTTVAGLSPSDLELPDYFLVVRGADPNGSYGEYSVTIEYTQTDDHPDDGEFTDVSAMTINQLTGLASTSGTLEIGADSDLFSFVALANGPATISVNAGSSPLLPAIRIIGPDQATVLASDDSGGALSSVDFDILRGETYYIVIEKSGSATPGANDTGAYGISIAIPPVDDHANQGEFSLATLLILDSTSGDGGLGSAFLTPATRDTDLFRFTTVADGDVTVTIDASLNGLVGMFAPSLRVFDEAHTEVGSSSTMVVGGTVSFTINDALGGHEYFILVADSIGLLTGEYSVAIDGVGTSGGNPGDVDFGNVKVVSEDLFTGDGSRTGSIDEAGERDLFGFTVPDATGRSRLTRVFIQVRTPDGSLLDAAITVLDEPNETAVIAQDSDGIPGASASAEVLVPAGQQLYVIVNDATLTNTGAYTIYVDTEPETFYLYYPEGFASSAISEFLSIANANDYDVHFTVRVYYEVSGGSATVVNNRLIAAGTRGGVTMSDGQGGYHAGITPDDPYSVVIESDGPLAATQARYDFGSAVGDSFTERVSDTWTFARIERDPGSINDFVVWYNPNPFDVSVSFDVVLSDSSTVTITRTVGGNQRGGLNINNQLPLPLGVFGATVTAEAADSVNDGDFRGIVAGLSHFDAVDQAGFGMLGDADGGATQGAITSLTRGDGVTSEIDIYNPGTTVANVVLTGKYIRNDFANLIRNLQIDPGQTLRLTGTQLGLISGQPAGIEFSSDAPVSLVSAENQLGEANATAASPLAGQAWFFGDGFINSNLAGELYFETLSFYNPTGVDTTVSVRLLFSDSDVVTININVGAGDFAELLLHEAPEILSRPNPLNFFSIEASAATPFVASLTHYDLFLRGGWGNSGSSLGLLIPIADIV